MRRRAAALLLLLALCAGPAAADEAPADPPWVADVLGTYCGTVLNEGRTERQRTVLSLEAGHLVGHYWIDADDPFEGTLTGFEPSSATGGRFTWADRYGTGALAVVFASDRSGFAGAWGAESGPALNPMSGRRVGADGCGAQVSGLPTRSREG